MENNNKYMQNTMIVSKTVYEDKDGNTKYNYLVPVRTYDVQKRKYVGELVIINSEYEHDIKDEIIVKSNKSQISGEIYFTEVKYENKNVCDEDLPFQP